MPSRRDPAVVRRWVAALAGAAGLLMIIASFLPWITADTEDGGTTSITGWGGITGSSGIAGTNLNDVLDGDGTYRPGLIGLIFGVITVIAAIALAAVGGAARPHRVTAAVLALCGLLTAGWGLYRALAPGEANVFQPGETSAGLGPWCTALAGVLAIVAAGLILAGRIDPPAPPVRRSIQPR
jgi:hypothetical protein